MKFTRSSIALVALLLPLMAVAQEDQVACSRKFDEQLKDAGTGTVNVAGAFNYKLLLEHATQCIQAGKCVKAEVLMSMSEWMVDDEVIRLQKDKLARMKAYFAKNRSNFTSKNYCAIAATFPSVMEEIRSLNSAQLDRFNVLAKQGLEALTVQ